MAQLPRMRSGLGGVKWWMDGEYLRVSSDVGEFRMHIPGQAVLDLAVDAAAGAIRARRYAAAH